MDDPSPSATLGNSPTSPKRQSVLSNIIIANDKVIDEIIDSLQNLESGISPLLASPEDNAPLGGDSPIGSSPVILSLTETNSQLIQILNRVQSLLYRSEI